MLASTCVYRITLGIKFADLRDVKCLKTQNVSMERQPTCPIKEMCPNVEMR